MSNVAQEKCTIAQRYWAEKILSCKKGMFAKTTAC